LTIVNCTAALVPPPGGGVVTVIGKTPDFCSNDPGMVTERDVAETKTVVRLVVAPEVTAEATVLLANPVPASVTVVATVDIGIFAGETLVKAGSALVTVKVPGAVAEPPPGAGFDTPIGKLFAPCRKLAGIVPLNEPEEPNVVGMAVFPNVIVELLTKLLPLT
jgi:hypothetical protein